MAGPDDRHHLSSENSDGIGSAGGWLLVADVEISVMGLSEDVCRIGLLRGIDEDIVRLRHRQMPDLDGEVQCPPTTGADRDAAIAAVTHAARSGRLDVTRPLSPGLLTLDECRSAVERGDSQWRADREAARTASLAGERATPSEIISRARELGLGPEPDPSGPTRWQGRCPGRSHSLMLSPGTETFGCGYCKVKGGPDDLTALVRRRAGRRTP